jgi:hypothetical protein
VCENCHCYTFCSRPAADRERHSTCRVWVRLTSLPGPHQRLYCLKASLAGRAMRSLCCCQFSEENNRPSRRCSGSGQIVVCNLVSSYYRIGCGGRLPKQLQGTSIEYRAFRYSSKDLRVVVVLFKNIVDTSTLFNGVGPSPTEAHEQGMISH